MGTGTSFYDDLFCVLVSLSPSQMPEPRKARRQGAINLDGVLNDNKPVLDNLSTVISTPPHRRR